MPVGNVLVCNTRGYVKHDDTALAVDVVSISEASELLLTGSIPDIELDRTKVLSPLSVLCLQTERGAHTVVKPRGWTSTPRVAIYFFSNSPVKWRLTKVVYTKFEVSMCSADIRKIICAGLFIGDQGCELPAKQQQKL